MVIWDEETSTEKPDIPPLIHKLFQYEKFSEKLNGPRKNFSALSDEKKRRKFVIPPFRLALYFFPSQNISGKQKAQLIKFFVRVLWGKIFSTQPNAPCLMHKKCQKKNYTPRFSPANFYGTVRQINFDGRTLYPVSSPKKPFSMPGFFWKHRKVPNKIFQYCDSKLFRRKNVIPPSLIHTKIPLPEIFWKTEEFQRKFFGNVRQEKIEGKTWYPPCTH